MIHTPSTSNAYLTLINTLSTMQFVNSSYFHDCTDSIYNEALSVRIFLPNVTDHYAERQDEEYTTFSLVFEDDGQGQQYLTKQFENVGELISLLNTFDRELTVDGKPVKMHQFIKSNCDFYETIVAPVLALQIDDYYIITNTSGVTEIERTL